MPSYDVFDETRYFEPALDLGCLHIGGERIGVSICEDLWDAVALGRKLYGADPISKLASAGAEVIVNMAASPFEMGRASMREHLFKRQAARNKTTIVHVNQVGGDDELIFDGGSCVVSPDGRIVARAKSFAEDLLVVDTSDAGGRCEPVGDEMSRLSAALKLGLRDYVTKCGFKTVVLGLSGGIDSAVVATLAADALGPENVFALAMPSRYSSEHSLADARAVAGNLAIHLQEVPIEPIHSACEEGLSSLLAGGRTEIAYENIQARIRGAMVMAVSNSFGHLPLATGNKSELSTGYCTLYGDMCGGLAPIGDVLKTSVYKLAQQLNAEAGPDRIPQSVMEKLPSAELKPGQVDQEKLPPYELLDEILARYIEADQTAEAIIAAGFDAGEVRRVVRMVDLAEYKRRQAAPVLKVTSRAFGAGRRMPIAQKYIPAGDG
ncbi:MAG: NAD+ synthase [Planctomycetota bacterium]